MTLKAVLVTRPAEQSVGIIKAIEKNGIRPVPFPLFKLIGLPIDQPARQIVLNLDRYDRVIFVSGAAVQFGMQWVTDYWPQLPLSSTWIAVGRATADKLKEYAIQVVIPERENSEGLLALDELKHVGGNKVLILRGTEGREKLAETLRARGARVDYLATYRRSKVSRTPEDLTVCLTKYKVGSIMITSAAALSYLATLMQTEPASKEIKLILPSERLLDLAVEQGFSQCCLANGANDGSMLEALVKMIATDDSGKK